MAIRFAFSTLACPNWNIDVVAERAKEYGYDGVELAAPLNDPAKIKAALDAKGLKLACLATTIAMTGDPSRDTGLAEQCRKVIDSAAGVGCELVRILDTQIKPGHNRAAASVALARWLLPLGDYAAQRGVTLVVQNALSFRKASEIWSVLEHDCQPALASCWDIASAASVGETPAISVPVLGSRIQYVQVSDAKFDEQGVANFVPLGQGDVQVQKLLSRLRGIGYDGWVSVMWNKAGIPSLAEPEQVLPDAIKMLKEWTKPFEKPVPAKAAAKPAGPAAAKAPAAAKPVPAVKSDAAPTAAPTK